MGQVFCKVSSLISACESAQVFKPQIESVIGTLSHITFIHHQGHSYMSSLYKWLVSFLSDYIPCWISSLALSDLQWWSSLLLRTHSPCFLTPARPTHDYNIWVGASTEWGISLLCGSHQAMWCLLDGWKGPSRNIGWLEGVTVELAILALKVMGIHNVNILI